jgi:hypothetical protein
MTPKTPIGELRASLLARRPLALSCALAPILLMHNPIHAAKGDDCRGQGE